MQKTLLIKSMSYIFSSSKTFKIAFNEILPNNPSLLLTLPNPKDYYEKL